MNEIQISILDILTSLATIVALVALIYQIVQDQYSKKPHYKLEIKRIYTEEYCPKKTYETITICNAGNRPICIEMIGLTKPSDEIRLYDLKSSDILNGCDFPFVINVGEIKVIKIDVNNDTRQLLNDGIISVRDSRNCTFHQI